MSTTHSPVGRLTELILGLDFGDEQERLRYYEAYAVMVHVQLIAVPIVGAITILLTGHTATLPVAVMMAAVFATVGVAKVHLKHHHVRHELLVLSGKNRQYLAASVGAGLALIAATAARGFEAGIDTDFAAGAAVGMGGALCAVALRARRIPSSGSAEKLDG